MYGSTLTLQTNSGALAKTGYTFGGWNTNAAGTGTSYSAGQINVNLSTANVTLYAKWTPTYTVTYNGNGNTSGSVPASQTWSSGSTLTLQTNSGGIVKTGYTFSDWNTDAAGTGTNYSAGQANVNLGTASITLYAVWTANQTPVNPTVTVNSISNKLLGQSVTVNASSTTPCFRMAAKYTINGVGTWLETQYSSSYSASFTPSVLGNYTVTVYSRSYPEDDPRTGTGNSYTAFNVTQCTHPSYTYGSWVDISTASECEKQLRSCNSCPYSYWYTDTTHAYTDCTDTTCNDCGYVRTAPGHSYTYGSWVDISTASECEKQLRSCNNCSYSYWYTDTTHAYTDCTDTTCNDCGYVRTAPGHSYTYGSWVDISTASECEKQLRSCNNCAYSYWYIDTSHAWTNACDIICNDCGYTRSASHSYSGAWVDISTASECEKLVYTCSVCGDSYISYIDTTHAWSNACDNYCNDCGYYRSTSHSYTGAWIDISTASQCEKYVLTCSNCGYSYVSTIDTTHAWSNACDNHCNDCGYYRPTSHSYAGAWVDVSTSSTCEKYVMTCTNCGYSYVYSCDYSHYYPYFWSSTCSDCGYRRW